MTTLTDWLDRLNAPHTQRIDMTLDRVRTVWQRMGVVPSCFVILVGGTNGKGSTCAFLTHLLRAEGYTTGTYTSPHITHFNERIAINSTPVSDALCIAALEAVEAAREGVTLTYFEWVTLAAFWVFAQHPLDTWIIEVGLGGRLDATNLLDADVAILASIDLDHQYYLGNTRAAIGLEKLGIARSHRPLVLADPNPPEEVLQAAKHRAIPVLRLGEDYGYLIDSTQQWQYWMRPSPGEPLKQRFGMPWPALRGKHQILNASTALTALECIRDALPVSMQAIRQGLLSVEWSCRFQVLPGQPVTILDVAHNPHATYALAAALDAMPFYPSTWCVWGMLSDKDAETCARHLLPHVQHWAVCSLPGERKRSAEELQSLLKSLDVPDASILCFDRPRDAYIEVRQRALPSDRIVVTGSFLTLSDISQER